MILLVVGLFTPEKSPGEGYDYASLAPPFAGSSPEDLAQQVAKVS